MVLDRVRDILAEARVEPEEIAQKLAAVVVEPPPGLIDISELRIANEAQTALLAAIVAAADYRQYGPVLAPLLAYAQARESSLTHRNRTLTASFRAGTSGLPTGAPGRCAVP
jgi:hypothetical protein